LGFAEVVCALGYLVEHGADLLPFCIEFFELRRSDVGSVCCVI